MVATAFEIWAGKWCFEMSCVEEGALRVVYALSGEEEKDDN